MKPSSSPPLNPRITLVVVGVFCVLVWVLRSMLLPFVAGVALAWLLEPLVSHLSGFSFKNWRLPRGIAALLVLILTAASATGVVMMVVPLVHSQVMGIIAVMPHTLETLQARAMLWVDHFLVNTSEEDLARLRDVAAQYAGTAVSWGGKLLNRLVSSGIAVFDVITLLVVTPVVAFFTLRDWRALHDNAQALIPRPWLPTVQEQICAIDQTLSGFLRGQAMVCVCLAILYGTGLSLVGLQYGFTVGIIAGILSFVPYLGSTFCLITSLGLASVQFTEWQHFAQVLAVFFVVQSMEGYILVPKLVGERIGLHPVWVLFALFAGGALLGFTGVLIALPTAAALGVLTRFALARYRNTALWKGD